MAQRNTIQLKIASILEVPINSYAEEFTFVVNGQEFRTSRLLSDLLSSKICRIHIVDPTFDRMVINTKSKGDFSIFLNLSKFNEEKVEERSILFYKEIIENLGIEHFSISLIDTFEEENESIFTRIVRHRNEGLFDIERYNKEVKEISTKFFEYAENDQKGLKSVGYDILKDIISSNELKLKSEDQLLKFINSLYDESSEFYQLYEHVIFANATSEVMNEFISIFDYNDITRDLWTSLSKRLSSDIQLDDEVKYHRRYTVQIKTIPYKKGQELNGIIKYLTDKTGGNIHDNNTIEVTTNSPYSIYHPKNLLDSISGNDYYSKVRDQNAWVCFDFKKMKIEISNYSIKSSNINPGCHHIKNWVFEISDDGDKWTKIDEHSNYTELNGNLITKTFEVSQKRFARFCRLRNNGEYYGSNNNYSLVLNSIEFYGRLQEP